MLQAHYALRTTLHKTAKRPNFRFHLCSCHLTSPSTPAPEPYLVLEGSLSTAVWRSSPGQTQMKSIAKHGN